MTKNEKWTLGISITAILISLASLGYTIYSDVQEKSEFVDLNVTQRTDNYKVNFIERKFGNYAAIASTDWIATVSNNGSVPVSITDYELLAISNKKKWSYTNLNLGLTKLDGARLALPINLQPGNSKRFVVHVGYPVKNSVYKSVDINSMKARSIKVRQLKHKLAKNELDLWGNKVQATIKNDSIYTIEAPSFNELNVISFNLRLTTSRGNNISTTFAPYFSLPW